LVAATLRRRRSALRKLLESVVAAAAIALGYLILQFFGLQETVSGPVRIVDGDSLRRGETEIRLYGIDAPEYRQTCEDEFGAEWPCGRSAADYLRKLVGRQDVACDIQDTDRYGRSVSLCKAGSISLNDEMVRQGWAVAYARHSLRYKVLELGAETAHRGIWRGRFERPEDYRARHRRMQGGLAEEAED
jgi:endonuclease YncB( thermonuclease family)